MGVASTCTDLLIDMRARRKYVHVAKSGAVIIEVDFSPVW